jgi:hypothetical protein
MDTLPILPDDSAAEIERAREAVISTRDEKFPVLFENAPWELIEQIRSKKVRPPKVMPATLRVELKNYTHALFDASAATLIKHAGDETGNARNSVETSGSGVTHSTTPFSV